MTIERKTMLDKVELDKSGAVSIRLALMLVEGDQVLSTKYHRLAIDIYGDVVEQMGGVVEHLARDGYPPLPESALGLLRSGHQLIKDYLGFLPGTTRPELDLGHGGDGGVDPADGAGDPGEDGAAGDVGSVGGDLDGDGVSVAPDVVY